MRSTDRLQRFRDLSGKRGETKKMEALAIFFIAKKYEYYN
jgi:hypothetical protein